MFMDDVDYGRWADYLASFIDKQGCRIAECGCGTGEITARFKKRGFEITGLDISRDMLEAASVKARSMGLRIPFICMDMRELELHKPVQYVIAACDCVNYLVSRSAVEAFFRKAYGAIAPGGSLLFDVSSDYKLKNINGNNVFFDSRKDAAYVWNNNYDDETKLIEMDIEFFVLAPESHDGRRLYERFTEKHIQRAHSENELRTWLTEVGFSRIEVFNAFTRDSANDECERLQFVAYKEEVL